ncbi:hypothetical protein A3E39_03375 [Candidatus Uhrbacteria bacterium RIFCSPHIGHO2_12_FULL_60_25]|uniref:Uncharacterized protein n=1 Tax=Candidatus Uhrbacteria bacterium RIFCSPHIGHO2_12_FULL_60_25 TaxID=1802399 RepID=A0A1F7UMR1_9BACT|nr:MAG: hypothetical protein A3D73_03230 [Candidatus Uhrbacteria bacterium RIFCSPHIGHO2_02_FULL_60_44]OGL79552.1 MAG: hypothetical protein A3E39_03375 [Candidatus Uhrbacteria bacterium RIFCSPHIGHO2_12_FULL_60_25]
MNHRRVSVVSLALAASIPRIVFAQEFLKNVQGGAKTAAEPSGLATGPELPVLIGNLIGAALGLVGVVLLVMLIYAGFLWMTAGGNTETVKKAQQQIKNAIIGLIIIAASYAITSFVLQSFSGPVTGGGAE